MKKIWNLYLLLVFCLHLLPGPCHPAVSCPRPSERCDCTDVTIGDVSCSGVNGIPLNLPDITTFLDLDSNSIGPALLIHHMDNLNNLTLEQLFLSGTGLESIEVRAFSNQPNLLVLDLGRNNFRRLDDSTFFGLVKLKTLFLTKSSLIEIGEKLFTHTPSLEYLDLDGNMLTAIHTEFTSLTKLESLLIASNRINTIDDESFETQTKLRRLDMYDNRLTTPRPSWFENVVENNGTIKLSVPGKARNPWKCCKDAVDFKYFIYSIPVDYVSLEQLNINCFWPIQHQDQRIDNLTPEELEGTTCENTTVQSSTSAVYITSASIAKTLNQTSAGRTSAGIIPRKDTIIGVNATHRESESHGGKMQIVTGPMVVPVDSNFLRHLTNIHIIVLMVTMIVIAVLITALVVIRYTRERRKKDFERFLHNLPNSKDIDSEDDGALTTRTYRQDVAVYGSTGNIVDRHKGRTNMPSPDDTSSEGSGRYAKVQKRKPPPYIPPESPPGELSPDIQTGKGQINNSSSVGLVTRTRSGAFANRGFDIDGSDDDIWDISTMR